MTDVMRSCSRTGCRWPAAASLSFRYVSRQVWLLDLGEPDPMRYDLCPHHADALVVPRGWDRVDQRTAPAVLHEPSAQELTERAAGRCREPVAVPAPTPAPPSGRVRVNRYEDLVRDLPRLAAELAAVCGETERGGPGSAADERRRRDPNGVIVSIKAARRPPQ